MCICPRKKNFVLKKNYRETEELHEDSVDDPTIPLLAMTPRTVHTVNEEETVRRFLAIYGSKGSIINLVMDAAIYTATSSEIMWTEELRSIYIDIAKYYR